jgi:putative tryptophan/tyrosine transport system substrate-binding protein
MRRREFSLLGCLLVGLPLAARAQQSARIARIGWMSRGNASVPDGTMNAFRQGMRELGYTEGQGFVIEPRYADGKAEVMPTQAAELERLGVNVIIAGPFEALQAAKESTSRVPIIMTPSADPAVAGFVASLEHPGGNITGITEMMPELTPQRLGMLKQIVPALSRAAILWRPGTLSDATIEKVKEARPDGADIQLQLIAASGPADFEAGFAAMKQEGAEALVVLVNPIFFLQRKQIIDRATDHRLPAIYEWKGFAQSGGLISYGAVVGEVYRRAAGYVDKILKGAKPGDLPVEPPIKTELVINRKTAAALGLTIPPSLLARADEVIE